MIVALVGAPKVEREVRVCVAKSEGRVLQTEWRRITPPPPPPRSKRPRNYLHEQPLLPLAPPPWVLALAPSNVPAFHAATASWCISSWCWVRCDHHSSLAVVLAAGVRPFMLWNEDELYKVRTLWWYNRVHRRLVIPFVWINRWSQSRCFHAQICIYIHLSTTDSFQVFHKREVTFCSGKFKKSKTAVVLH